MNNEDFTFQFTADCREAVEQLKKELFGEDGVRVIYFEDADGNIFPVAEVMRHPDCPDGYFEKFLNLLER